ncbi:uncharacterized protein ACNS7B_002761 isoform 1-T2 [Menidia menidia]
MAAAEAAVSWLLSSGLVSFVLLILLSVLLSALCSDCYRRSFELGDGSLERNPSTLIRVVKLEEVQENPMSSQIQEDERECEATPGQQGEPQTEPPPGDGAPVTFTPWRSHLVEPQSKDLNGSTHIYQTVGEGGGSQAPANHKPAPQHKQDLGDENSVYARVSKKLRGAPVHTPEEAQVDKEEEKEEEPSPPLPQRTQEMEG